MNTIALIGLLMLIIPSTGVIIFGLGFLIHLSYKEEGLKGLIPAAVGAWLVTGSGLICWGVSHL